LTINFQSITNKGTELYNIISSSSPDIIIGTETHLDPTSDWLVVLLFVLLLCTVDLELSLFFGDDEAIGSNFPDVSSSIVVFRWCFGSDLVLFLDVSAVISIDVSWKFLILTAWLSGGGLEMLIGMTAGLSFIVLIGMGNNLSWICFQCGLPNFSTTFFETEERIEISNRFNTFYDSPPVMPINTFTL
jgi:hypothetical protein